MFSIALSLMERGQMVLFSILPFGCVGFRSQLDGRALRGAVAAENTQSPCLGLKKKSGDVSSL